MSTPIIKPTWPAPKNIMAFTTTRIGGVSKGSYNSLNVGDHVDDNPTHVAHNRAIMRQQLALPHEPAWLKQTHSTIAVYIDNEFRSCEADASFTDQPEQVCSVMTADCLPVLLTNKSGTEVAAIHAGWMGLSKGVIEATVKQLQSKSNELMAWLGPAMGPKVFEVGTDVYDIFIDYDLKATSGFTPYKKEKWLMDIYHLGRQRLNDVGISEIYGGDYCTYTDAERFFSYRRDKKTGRMASLIWIT